jgi:pimeloyl-ACP methyl ester carboxylesterase
VGCAERLQAEGIDLTAYNSRESAADIAELRVALGIEEWNLYGISYGTRLALSVLRYHPEGVRTVILDSVFPPEAAHLIDSAAFFRTALHRFLTGCIGRAPCSPPPDGPWAHYLRAHERLRQQPVEIDLSAIDPDVELVVTVDERSFDKLLLRALYSRESRGSIAAALRGLGGGAARNGEMPIRDLLAGFLEGSLKGSDAVSLSHICRDEMSFESAEQITAAAVMAGRWRRQITEDSDAYLCPVWPSGEADAVENTPVESDVPALLLAGILDPVTPPDLARSAAENLANNHVLEFLDAGHGVIYEVDCAGSLISEFLDHPRQRPKGDCRRSDLFSLQ